MPISDYNRSASLNTSLSGILVGEGMARGNVSDAIRQLMADIAADVAPSNHPQKYGAVGNGIANDTAAVQTTIATGREVYFPPGTYNLTPLAFSNLASLKIRGAGRDVTKIRLTSTGTALSFSNSQWVQISDISFEASGAPQSLANARAIQFDTNSSNSVVERCNFYGFSLGGMKQLGTAGVTLSGHVVRQCYFLGNGGNQLELNYSNDFTVEDNQFGILQGIAHAPVGCLLSNAQAGTYALNKHWNNGIGLKAVNGDFNGFHGNRFEESDQEGVYLDGCDYINFTGNRLHTNSQTTDGVSDNLYAVGVTSSNFTGNTIFSWNAKFTRWGMNFDTGCTDIVLGKNLIRGYDTTNFGPIRFAAGVANFSGDLILQGTGTAVAAGSTVYLSNGSSIAEGAAFRPVNRKYAVGKIYAATDAAPGAGQTFTYTLRKNGVDTAMVATSSGAASFTAGTVNSTPQVLLTDGDYLSLKLVTSAGATVANHRFYIVLVEY